MVVVDIKMTTTNISPDPNPHPNLLLKESILATKLALPLQLG